MDSPSQPGDLLMPQPIPDAYRVATPYLIVKGATEAIAFYKKALGAVEVVRLADSAGKVMHAELLINYSRIMLADEFPDMGYRSPQSYGGSSVSLLIYVNDVDAQFAQMISAGAKETMAVTDQFDGDRRGTVTDPFGHVWLLASRKEEISKEEMVRRFDAMMSQGV
jgi:PhnB protein